MNDRDIISFRSTPIRMVRNYKFFSMKEWTSPKHKPHLWPILHACSQPAIRIITILLTGRSKDETAVHCWPGYTWITGCARVCSIDHKYEQLEDAQHSRRNAFFIEDGQVFMDCSVIETENACLNVSLKIHRTLMFFFLERVIIAPY